MERRKPEYVRGLLWCLCTLLLQPIVAMQHVHSLNELHNLLANTEQTEAMLGETSVGKAVIARTRQQIANAQQGRSNMQSRDN